MTKYIENIHVDEERVDVLTKNVKTNNGIRLTKSDHNIITTKLNISWTTHQTKVMEIFNFKDTKSLGMFKQATTKTDHLSKIIDSEKSIHLVTKKFLKRLQGFVHQCFKKIRIVEKEDRNLTEMYNARRLLRTKSDEDSLKKLDELENKLSEEYSDRMFNKIMGEIKDTGDSEEGGFSSGKLWKLKKKIAPKFTEPPTSMINSEGKMLKNNEEIKNEAIKHYENVFSHSKIKDGLENIQKTQESLCLKRLGLASQQKTPDWTIANVKCALKQLKSGKSKDPYDMPNELFGP